MVIQIQISDELWEYFKTEKQRAESFDEVIKRKLKFKEKETPKFKVSRSKK